MYDASGISYEEREKPRADRHVEGISLVAEQLVAGAAAPAAARVAEADLEPIDRRVVAAAKW